MDADDPPRPPSSDAANAGTWLALFGVIIVSLCLMGLIALVLGPFTFLIFVLVFLFLCATAGQYLLWGRWLSRRNREEDER
jgi:hypothetical protein